MTNAVRQLVNSNCTCGGRGPRDAGACVFCQVWHAHEAKMREAVGAERARLLKGGHFEAVNCVGDGMGVYDTIEEAGAFILSLDRKIGRENEGDQVFHIVQRDVTDEAVAAIRHRAGSGG